MDEEEGEWDSELTIEEIISLVSKRKSKFGRNSSRPSGRLRNVSKESSTSPEGEEGQKNSTAAEHSSGLRGIGSAFRTSSSKLETHHYSTASAVHPRLSPENKDASSHQSSSNYTRLSPENAEKSACNYSLSNNKVLSTDDTEKSMSKYSLSTHRKLSPENAEKPPSTVSERSLPLISSIRIQPVVCKTDAKNNVEPSLNLPEKRFTDFQNISSSMKLAKMTPLKNLSEEKENVLNFNRLGKIFEGEDSKTSLTGKPQNLVEYPQTSQSNSELFRVGKETTLESRLNVQGSEVRMQSSESHQSKRNYPSVCKELDNITPPSKVPHISSSNFMSVRPSSAVSSLQPASQEKNQLLGSQPAGSTDDSDRISTNLGNKLVTNQVAQSDTRNMQEINVSKRTTAEIRNTQDIGVPVKSNVEPRHTQEIIEVKKQNNISQESSSRSQPLSSDNGYVSGNGASAQNRPPTFQTPSVPRIRLKPPTPPTTQKSSKKIDHIEVNGHEYMKLELLGRGGSSKVYEVFDLETRKLKAIKLVELEGLDEATLKSYENEIEILQRLQWSDKVVKLYDYENTGEYLKLVMEKGDVDFSGVLNNTRGRQRAPISSFTIKHYWHGMLQAVQAIHSEGIIHSDLKPANFVLVNQIVKLIDFGIASSIQQDMTSVIKDSQAGTFNYMSPESTRDVHTGPLINKLSADKVTIKIGVKSDVWSLGCILYNLVYGRTPFQHISNPLRKLAAISDPTTKISFKEIENKHLEDVMRRCLQFDPYKRPSIEELLQHPYLTEKESGATSVTPDKAATIKSAMDQLAQLTPNSLSRITSMMQQMKPGT